MIAVTGAGSGLGRALVEKLAARTDFGGLLGIDTVPARIDGVVWHAMDVRDASCPAGCPAPTPWFTSLPRTTSRCPPRPVAPSTCRAPSTCWSRPREARRQAGRAVHVGEVYGARAGQPGAAEGPRDAAWASPTRGRSRTTTR